ncbi:MAG TPA: hypothetical protein VGV15_20245 [Terriglobales bacterium]|nr:hypothetical protein [Terriglobales bacterium]
MKNVREVSSGTKRTHPLALINVRYLREAAKNSDPHRAWKAVERLAAAAAGGATADH